MIPYRSRFDNSARTNMYVVPDLHGIEIEVPSISLVWGPEVPKHSYEPLTGPEDSKIA